MIFCGQKGSDDHAGPGDEAFGWTLFEMHVKLYILDADHKFMFAV